MFSFWSVLAAVPRKLNKTLLGTFDRSRAVFAFGAFPIYVICLAAWGLIYLALDGPGVAMLILRSIWWIAFLIFGVGTWPLTALLIVTCYFELFSQLGLRLAKRLAQECHRAIDWFR